jgi:hypothetical protein
MSLVARIEMASKFACLRASPSDLHYLSPEARHRRLRQLRRWPARAGIVIAKNDDAAICTGSSLQIWLTGNLWIKYLCGALG